MPVFAIDYTRNGSNQFLNVLAKNFDEATAALKRRHPAAQIQSVQNAGEYIRANASEPSHVSQNGKVQTVRTLKNGTIRALLGKYPSSLGIHAALRSEASRRGIRTA